MPDESVVKVSAEESQALETVKAMNLSMSDLLDRLERLPQCKKLSDLQFRVLQRLTRHLTFGAKGVILNYAQRIPHSRQHYADTCNVPNLRVVTNIFTKLKALNMASWEGVGNATERFLTPSFVAILGGFVLAETVPKEPAGQDEPTLQDVDGHVEPTLQDVGPPTLQDVGPYTAECRCSNIEGLDSEVRSEELDGMGGKPISIIQKVKSPIENRSDEGWDAVNFMAGWERTFVDARYKPIAFFKHADVHNAWAKALVKERGMSYLRQVYVYQQYKAREFRESRIYKGKDNFAAWQKWMEEDLEDGKWKLIREAGTA